MILDYLGGTNVMTRFLGEDKGREEGYSEALWGLDNEDREKEA